MCVNVKCICIIHICEIFIALLCSVSTFQFTQTGPGFHCRKQLVQALWYRKQLQLAWCSSQKAPGKADMFRSCSKTVVLLVIGT